MIRNSSGKGLETLLDVLWKSCGNKLELPCKYFGTCTETEYQKVRILEFFGNSLYNSFERTWNYHGNILEIV